MKKNTLCLLLLLASFGVFSQQNYYLKTTNGKVSYQAAASLRTYFETAFKVPSEGNAMVVIEPSIKKGSSKMIEGMDTKTIAKSTLFFNVSNAITKKDSLLKFDAESSTKAGEDQDKTIINKFLENSEATKKMNGLIQLFQKEAATSCTAYSQSLEKLRTAGKLREAMKSIALLEVNELCTNETKALREQILNQYSEEECSKLLFDSKVLIASGTEYNLSRAVDLLLKTPPTQKCRTESLKVIEELSTKSGLTSKSKLNVELYKNILDQVDYSSWYRLLLKE
jgi:hypothetical protein